MWIQVCRSGVSANESGRQSKWHAASRASVKRTRLPDKTSLQAPRRVRAVVAHRRENHHTQRRSDMRTNVLSSKVETLKTHLKRVSAFGFAAAVLLAGAAPSWGTESTAAAAPLKSVSDTVPLYTNLGSHHKPISTQVPA